MERLRGMDELAMSAQPTMKAPSTRTACAMCMALLKRSANVKNPSKNSIVAVWVDVCRWTGLAVGRKETQPYKLMCMKYSEAIAIVIAIQSRL